MPRDLFGDVTRPSISIGNRKWYTLPVSLLSHSAIVLAFVVIPLLATDALPDPWERISLILDAPAIPTPPPAPPDRSNPPRPVDPIDSSIPPVNVPTGINPEPPEPIVEHPGTPDGVVLGTVDNVSVLIPPPPIVAPPPQPLRVGGAIRQPQRVHHVQPVYPSIAQSARIEGIVIIEATIGEDGQVINARILRSVPLLDQAAIDAVRQWQYTPTTLNGVPVPVIMSVTVQFTLQ
jgi:periplasmic protein TonB